MTPLLLVVVQGGLSAGVYLQRYLLDTLIIDKGKAPLFLDDRTS